MCNPESLLSSLDAAQHALGWGEGQQGVADTREWALRNSTLMARGLDKV